MYFGYYEHNLDDKGRLMIPSRLREGLVCGSPLYVVNGFDGYLGVYNEESYKSLCSHLEQYSDFNQDARKVKRNVYSSTFVLNVDKIGRIQIPNSVLERYEIGQKVVVLGVGDHFEIWDLEAYKSYQDTYDKEISSLADKLERENGQ